MAGRPNRRALNNTNKTLLQQYRDYDPAWHTKKDLMARFIKGEAPPGTAVAVAPAVQVAPVRVPAPTGPAHVALPTLDVMLDFDKSFRYWHSVVRQVVGDWLFQEIDVADVRAAQESGSGSGPFFNTAEALLRVVERKIGVAESERDEKAAEAYQTAHDDIDDVRLETFKRKSPAANRLMDEYEDTLTLQQKKRYAESAAESAAAKAAAAAAERQARIARLRAAEAEEERLRAELAALRRSYDQWLEQDRAYPGGHAAFSAKLTAAQNALNRAERAADTERLRAKGYIV